MPLRKFLAVLAAVCLTLSMVGCQQNDVSSGQADTEQTVSETQQTTETTTQTEQTTTQTEQTTAQSEQVSETTEVSGMETVLDIYMKTLDDYLEEYRMFNHVTYGVIDYNNDGTDEFFAVISDGGQGYKEMNFYSIDDSQNVTELFSTYGFCRDGDTYFMYDDEAARLLIFSGYTHSYFIKNEKTEAVSNDGKVSVLFEAWWGADSAKEELEQTETYIDSVEVSTDEYNNEYDIFMGKEYQNIIYIYDGKLFDGSELIDSENVYQDYLSRKG
ncbi:MAG: hypothetical protein K2K44_09830 [Oscillospiraceae bacterium]|nr:hypothetical protein [Oscillospiraceae bacterium]